MFASVLSLSLCVGVFPSTGTLLTYEGEITPDRTEDAVKAIGYTGLVVESGDVGTHVYWSVTEKGNGSWPWVDQFGQLKIDAHGKIVGGHPASVLLEHADGISPVPLVPPVFAAPKALQEGAAWRVDRLQFAARVPEDRELAESNWQIDVNTPIGHKQTLLVDRESGAVQDVDETVFVGPGKKHRLRLTLTGAKSLDAIGLARAREAFDALFALREEVAHETHRRRVPWSDDQLATLKERLPEVIEKSAGTPVERLALLAGGDVKLQKAVAAATEQLQKRFVGQPVPKLELKAASLSGSALSTTDAAGKPLVLHIWDYKDNPLVEPYGQIGYLDFLYRRHKADGVLVFGIAVDERLDRPDTHSNAVRSVRKLQSFMNLGYPIVLGGSKVLEEFGDPQRLGADLPLVVVIDSEGKITHYHLGLYDVDRDSGLAELDAAVEKVK